jgi:hypothetical protein
MSNVFPLPFPQETLPPFDIDVSALFTFVSSQIADMRSRRGLLPLIPQSQVVVGQEQLPQEYDAPNIIVVPRGFRFEPGQTRKGEFDRMFLQMQWLECECHLWGDEDPKGIDALYSFGSSIELLRELVVCLTSALGSPSNVKIDGARWAQRTDVNRKGRVLVADISLRYFVLTDPPIRAALAQPGTPGIRPTITAQLQSQDGTSTVTEAIFSTP